MRSAWRTASRRPAGRRRPSVGRLQGRTLGRTPVRRAAFVRRAVGLANGHPGKTAVRRVVGYADGGANGQHTARRTARQTGGQTSTGWNNYLQHREYKTPPSAGRSGFYSEVKLTKSRCHRTSPPSGGCPTSGTSDVSDVGLPDNPGFVSCH